MIPTQPRCCLAQGRAAVAMELLSTVNCQWSRQLVPHTPPAAPPPHQVHRVRLHVCGPGGGAAQGRPQVRLSVMAACEAQLAAARTRRPAAGHLEPSAHQAIGYPAANLSSRRNCQVAARGAPLFCALDAKRSPHPLLLPRCPIVRFPALFRSTACPLFTCRHSGPLLHLCTLLARAAPAPYD